MAPKCAVPQTYGLKSQDRNGPVVLYNGMINAHAIKLLSPRTVSLLRQHAKVIGVDAAKLASDLIEMMGQEGLHKAVLDNQNTLRA